LLIRVEAMAAFALFWLFVLRESSRPGATIEEIAERLKSWELLNSELSPDRGVFLETSAIPTAVAD
jgi:hypothetical protein